MTSTEIAAQDIDTVDDYRTWVFDADEGGAVSITASETHLSIDTEYASYEGHRTRELVFVHHTAADRFPVGVHDNSDHGSPTRVLVDPAKDLRDAWADYLQAQLGHYLRCNWVRTQPEPLHY